MAHKSDKVVAGPRVASPAESAILRAWADIELFQMVKLPDALRDGTNRVAKLDTCVAGPWPAEPAKREPRKPLLATRVYVGCVDASLTSRWLKAAFRHDERLQQTGAVGGRNYRGYFDVDSEGWPVSDSFTPCSVLDFAFDIAHVSTLGAVTDDDLDAAVTAAQRRSEQMRERYAELCDQIDDAENYEPQKAYAHVVRTAAAIDALGVSITWSTAAGQSMYPESYFCSRWVKTEDDIEPELLESFFRSDLQAALRQVTPLLASYLSSHPSERPTVAGDVSERGVLEQLVNPDLIPPAAWPSPYSLRLSQQIAVTAILRASKAATPLLSVNGPPGTGKTTLLRDLYANIVTLRARALVAYKDPLEAFGAAKTVYAHDGDRQFPRTLRAPQKQITGWEMLVASTSNPAVENVSKALPALSSLGEQHRDSTTYFRSVASQINQDLESWGIAAAVLGKRSNIGSFLRALGVFKRGTDNTATFLTELTAVTDPDGWKAARTRFENADKAVRGAIAARGEVIRYRASLPALQQSVVAARARFDAAQTELALASAAAPLAANEAALASSAKQTVEQELAHLIAIRPSAWQRFRQSEGAAQWDALRDQLVSRLASATAAVAAAESAAKSASQDQQRRITQLQVAIGEQERAEENFQSALRGARFDGAGIVDEAWWTAFHEQPEVIQLGNAWIDARLEAARVELFQSSMNVHEMFLRAAGGVVEQNLRVWASLVNGELSDSDRSEAALPAWQSLFLAVPMVSTTFASLSRLLSDLGPSSLGYLIVDEAGQATPQAAVGGLVRFQQAVIVGDPDQLEPVVPLPGVLLDRLMERHQATRQLAPHRTSVQAMADGRSALGTERRQRWVGLPLLVHNRCLNPMFEIANQIAYDNKMVQGRSAPPGGVYAPMGESRWIHIRHQGTNHWSPSYGPPVLDLLNTLDWTRPISIALLSPFTSVVAGLRNLQSGFIEQQAWTAAQKKECEALLAVGTVHTFQGKEVDAVILVLGGATAGARDWASTQPNLINVAVTRAKNSLYVVGDRDNWTAGCAAILRNKLPWLDGTGG